MPSEPTASIDEENWRKNDLVEVDEGWQVGVRRLISDLLNSCRAQGRKVPESMLEAVGLHVDLMDGADGLLLPGKQSAADLRID